MNKLFIIFSCIHKNYVFSHRDLGGVSLSASKHTTLTIFNQKSTIMNKLFKILIQYQLLNYKKAYITKLLLFLEI